MYYRLTRNKWFADLIVQYIQLSWLLKMMLSLITIWINSKTVIKSFMIHWLWENINNLMINMTGDTKLHGMEQPCMILMKVSTKILPDFSRFLENITGMPASYTTWWRLPRWTEANLSGQLVVRMILWEEFKLEILRNLL